MARSDYISREAICLTDFEIAMCNGDYKELCKMLLDKIANVPAADVRPVVYCRDCKDWKRSELTPSYHVCTYVIGAQFVRKAEDFCSRGEKREES